MKLKNFLLELFWPEKKKLKIRLFLKPSFKSNVRVYFAVTSSKTERNKSLEFSYNWKNRILRHFGQKALKIYFLASTPFK